MAHNSAVDHRRRRLYDSLGHAHPPEHFRSLTRSLIVYADWCGPCKMIAPTFESLATKYTKPKRIAFAKIDADKLRDVASQYGVRAMPTFVIFKNGSAIETIQGANPPKLTQAVESAVKLAGPVANAGFSAPGRTLGGPSAGGQRQSLRRPIKWDLRNFINAIIGFFGLYFVSLFSVSSCEPVVVLDDTFANSTLSQFDPYKAAETSRYNVHNPSVPTTTPGGSAGTVKKPAAKPAAFKTLADLGGD